MSGAMAFPASNLNSFQTRLARAKEAVVRSGLKEALVIHHDEADGVCSGTLTRVALQKMGLQTRLICLDKLYPEVVKDIESGPRRVVAYSDIGSGHMEWLSKWNKTDNLILTLDHHDTADLKDPLVHNLNPELDGFSGERDACSSTVAYLFAKTVEASSTSFAPLARYRAKQRGSI
jgi:single-stranded DNA-specific DHH superfamily exonuclease